MKLDESDVRDMVRLVGEVAALPGGHTEKKRYLMEGLCKLVDADAWIWGLSCQRDPDKPQVYVSILRGGITEEQFARFLQAVEHPQMIDFASRFFIELKEGQTHLTRLRTQIADEARFVGSDAQAAWKLANLGPTILSMRPIDPQSSSAIGLYRHFDRPHFTARESRIAHIILTEVPWLHLQGWPEDRGVSVPTLSKRQRLALNLLILGQSHKQIASHMSISPNTLQGYIKDIYRHFGVNSQAELMNRFFQGNGRDVG
jgi:DNA-binding CsgD family transcriptional regulator